MTAAPNSAKTPLKDILSYASGDAVNSLVMNTFYSFAMLYYTKAMGMSGTYAGVAMAIATLWDAVTDPLMGHISDNTRSRFGRRHPYILIGGILTVVCFYAVWAVPSFCRTPERLFWYLVAMNMLLRTFSTVFAVPFVALGFEICTDYNQRTTLQSIRGGLNMALNLIGPALLGWSVFLRDRDGVKGSGVTIAENFQRMGLTFALIGLAFVLVVTFATRRYAVDSRGRTDIVGNNIVTIIVDLARVFIDRLSLMVFAFIFILFVGVVLVTSMQMYVYDDFMHFAEWQKTIVHGGTMVAAGLGALLAAPVVRLLDKKQAIYGFLLLACLGNVVLIALFGTGRISPDLAWGAVPAAMLVFMLFHVCFHMGATAANTIASSMMADISEVNLYRTGLLKDGSYSAMLSFVLKTSITVGLVICGLALDAMGFDPSAQHQTPEVARRLLLAGFGGGGIITLIAMAALIFYPVNRAYMAGIKRALAAGREGPGAFPVVAPERAD